MFTEVDCNVYTWPHLSKFVNRDPTHPPPCQAGLHSAESDESEFASSGLAVNCLTDTSRRDDVEDARLTGRQINSHYL